VKYSGLAVPELNIQPGDPLNVVIEGITNSVVTILTGDGVVPTLDPADICATVQSYLPTSGIVTLNDVLTALIKSICDIDTMVTGLSQEVADIEKGYTVGCLSGVDGFSKTHEVVQAILNKVCQVDSDLGDLTSELHSNYVLHTELNNLIQAYLNSIAPAGSNYLKMVKNVAYPYWGDTTGFDSTGKGIAPLWDKVYLCNGQNGTPDLRGITLVGATDMQGGTDLVDEVKPGVNGNPNYSWLDHTIRGANQIVLTASQMPKHDHTASLLLSETPHTHTGTAVGPYSGTYIPNSGGFGGGSNLWQYNSITINPAVTGITGTVTINKSGNDQAHANTQPSKSINYIIYL
jgi:microcystin-dependent protein